MLQFSPPTDDSSFSSADIPFKFTVKEYLPEPPTKTKIRLELTHAHSYDFTNRLVHVRKGLSSEEKALVKEHYSHVSVMHGKMKVRDPNTYAEIFQETSRDATGQIFSIQVEFQPSPSSYGKKFTILHEILHLDVHLGPSVPLHLHAKIVPKDSSCACMKRVKFLSPEKDFCHETQNN